MADQDYDSSLPLRRILGGAFGGASVWSKDEEDPKICALHQTLRFFTKSARSKSSADMGHTKAEWLSFFATRAGSLGGHLGGASLEGGAKMRRNKPPRAMMCTWNWRFH